MHSPVVRLKMRKADEPSLTPRDGRVELAEEHMVVTLNIALAYGGRRHHGRCIVKFHTPQVEPALA